MKYPKTLHLPNSFGLTAGDKRIKNLDGLLNKEVIITEKLDGECTSLYFDRCHARSEDSRNHPSRNWIKNLWGNIKHSIPPNLQLIGENIYAKHSIYYDSLTTYFYLFAIFDLESKIVLSWNETRKWAKLLDIQTVPILYI